MADRDAERDAWVAGITDDRTSHAFAAVPREVPTSEVFAGWAAEATELARTGEADRG